MHIFKIALSGLKSTAGSKNLAVVSNASPQRDISRKAGKVAKLPISTKRSKWAEEEAASLGVAAVKDKVTLAEGWSQRWDAFILLLETLEEYGTHLVEAAWSHQVISLASMHPNVLAVKREVIIVNSLRSLVCVSY